ncbi:MAG TPA: TonB-dependent receptor [Bryobacteraceae bacterium]
MKTVRSLFFLTLCAGPLLAQNVTATLVGTVKDSTGAVVPGSTVTAVNAGTALRRATQTGADGSYSLPLLPPGTYRLTAEKQGFKRAEVDAFQLQVDQTARVDVVLVVGSVQESLTITASAPLVASETSSIGQVIAEKAIENLPLNGRSFYNLVLLAPGTTPTMPKSFIAGNHAIPGQLTTPAFYVGGAREKSNGYLVDGVDAQDPHFQTPSLFPSVDTIQEFKLETNAYSAEYGHFASQVNVATKSGTNELHGSAYEFLRNDAIDAANFFTNLNGLKKSPLRYNQFGATLGGPVEIPHVYKGTNKTFYFASWESTRIRKGSTAQLSVPTAEQRNGDFSRLGFRNNQRIFDPATTRIVNGAIVRDPFPGNMIPAGRITPFGSAIMTYYPSATSAAASGNNYATGLNDLSDSDQFMGRIDHHFNESNNLFFRYSIMSGNLTDFSAIPLNSAHTDAKTQNLALNFVHIINPATVYELRLGYNRPTYLNLQNSAYGPNLAAQLGLKNLLQEPIAFGLPNISITNVSGLGAGTFIPSTQRTNSYQLFQEITLTRGRHSIKTGADIRKLNYNDLTERQQNGQLGFTGGLTANPASASNTGIALADALLGLPLTAAGSSQSLAGAYNGFSYGFFVQDDWKVNQRVTLNLGMRYDLAPRMTEKLNHLTAFDRSYPGGRVLLSGACTAYIPGLGTSDGRCIPRGVVPTDKNDWGPRVGIAIRPFNDNRTAIRAGYGIFYDMIELQDLRTWTRNPPYGAIFSLQSDQNGNANTPAVLKITDLFPAQGSLQAQPDIYSPGDKYVDPYYQQWNFDVQRQFASNLLIDIGYMGTKGTHLARRLLANQAPLDANPAHPTPIQTRRPYPRFGNTIRLTDDDANSTYHALLVKAEKRFSQGLSFLFSYTYAKALDSGSLIDDTPRDIYNLSLDKGRADFDIRQRAVFSASWELPFGKGKPFLTGGIGGALLGGWQLNTITALRSGFPFSVSASGDACNCAATNQLAEQVGDPFSGFTQSRSLWFNTAAFAQPIRGTFGSSGRNIMTGPAEETIDLSIFRTFTIGERVRLQFRGESFNLLNHTNFGLPGSTVASSSYGLIQSASSSRNIQFGLKLNF